MSVCVLKVWELSDLDRDGMLDKDEFSVVRNELIVDLTIVELLYSTLYCFTQYITALIIQSYQCFLALTVKRVFSLVVTI